MIRRLLVFFGALIATVAFATPVAADGAFTATQNIHGPLPPMHVDAACGAPAGMVFGSGNAVFHITVNAAGDMWITTTQEENFTFVPDVGTLTASGHFAAWFGVSLNNQNAVQHNIVNVQATFSDGTSLTFNMVDHLSVSANGQVNLFTTCH